MSDAMFAADFKPEPYWWDRTPRPQLPSALPEQADVVVVGSGYSGLHAAIQIARGGRSTLVLDAEDAGWGCSSRNGGQVSTSIRVSYGKLERKYGKDIAVGLLSEGEQALEWIGEFIAQEQIDCDFHRVGRFFAAHNPASYERITREYEQTPPDLRPDAHVVSRADQHQELGTDAYHGGMVFSKHASLDPARYHQGLLGIAQGAGVSFATQCAALGVERSSGTEFDVHTSNGKVRARDVVVATNGYSKSLLPWLGRRLIPIGSYMIATEELPAAQMDRLMPKKRIISDTRKVVYYYRPAPDGRRILFGGRVSFGETEPRNSAPSLKAALVRVFPELADVRISRSWMGFVAYTFDGMAHVGSRDGIHYAGGYCGSGISMASYLGMRLGARVLGKAEGDTAFAKTPFQSRAYYTGNPWFLRPAVMYYRLRDRLGWY